MFNIFILLLIFCFIFQSFVLYFFFVYIYELQIIRVQIKRGAVYIKKTLSGSSRIPRASYNHKLKQLQTKTYNPSFQVLWMRRKTCYWEILTPQITHHQTHGRTDELYSSVSRGFITLELVLFMSLSFMTSAKLSTLGFCVLFPDWLKVQMIYTLS